MELKKRIELTQQTLAALLAVNNNDGKVPDGFVLEVMLSSGWKKSCYPNAEVGAYHYRLTPAA